MNHNILSSVTNDEIKHVTGKPLVRSMLDTLPGGFQVLRADRNKDSQIVDFTYVYVNKPAGAYVGKDIVGKQMRNQFPCEKKDSLFQKCATVVNTGITQDYIHQYRDEGLNNWFHNVILKFGDGVLFTHEDITSLKAAEELLKDREAFISLVTSSATDIIYILDLETRTFSYVDEKVEKTFGFTPAHIYEQGHNIFLDIMHPDDYLKRMLQLNKLENMANEDFVEVEARIK